MMATSLLPSLFFSSFVTVNKTMVISLLPLPFFSLLLEAKMGGSKKLVAITFFFFFFVGVVAKKVIAIVVTFFKCFAAKKAMAC